MCSIISYVSLEVITSIKLHLQTQSDGRINIYWDSARIFGHFAVCITRWCISHSTYGAAERERETERDAEGIYKRLFRIQQRLHWNNTVYYRGGRFYRCKLLVVTMYEIQQLRWERASSAVWFSALSDEIGRSSEHEETGRVSLVYYTLSSPEYVTHYTLCMANFAAGSI